MEIEMILDDGSYCPIRGHEKDAGLDLRTPIDVLVPAHGSAVIDTGTHLAIPEGYFGHLESKSGLNVKHNIVSLGGIIDSGYSGSIVAKLYNMGDEDYQFYAGDKIVQIIIQPFVAPKLKAVNEFPETERGDNGFGSTGK